MTEKLDSKKFSAGDGKRFFFGTLVILFFWLVLGSYTTHLLSFLLKYPVVNPYQYSTVQVTAVVRSDSLQYYASFVILQSSFIPLLIGILLTVRFILHSSVRSFITRHKKFRLRRTAISFVIWFSAAALFSFCEFLLFPESFSSQMPGYSGFSEAAGIRFSAEIFFPFLLLACLFIPIQVFAEELLFRAYLWNWTASLQPSSHADRVRRSADRAWLPAVLSGLLFAAAHTANPEIAQADSLNRTLLLLYFFLFGVFLMLVTIHDGSIEAAVGIHLANNMFTLIILNYQGSALPTPSLFLTESVNPAGSLLFLCIGFLIIRFTLFRRTAQES